MTAPGQLPEPLTPPDCDLRKLPSMLLDVAFLDSTFATGEPDACWAGVRLWCKSWHQIPAGSLPDNDRELANMAGYGRDVGGWLAVKSQAMHKYMLCSDGRWYHPVVARKVLDVLAMRQKASENGRKSGEARRARADERELNGRSTGDERELNGRSTGDERELNGRSTGDERELNGRSTRFEQQEQEQEQEGFYSVKTDRQSEAVDNSAERSVIDPETGEITKVGEPDTENNSPPSCGGGDEGAPRPEPRTAVDQREEFNSPPPAGGAYTTPDRDETSTSGMQSPEQPSPGGVAFNGPRRNQAEVMVLASLVETELHKIGIPDCKRTSTVLLEQLAAGHSPESYVKAALQLQELLRRKPGSVKKQFGWIMTTVAAQGVAAPPVAAPLAPAKPKRAAAKPAAAPVDPAVVAKAKADLAELTEKMRATAKPLKRAGSVS